MPNIVQKTEKGTKFDIPVELVFHALSQMITQNQDQVFWLECQKRGLVISVSEELIDFTKQFLKQLPVKPHLRPTQDCPRCPSPNE